MKQPTEAAQRAARIAVRTQIVGVYLEHELPETVLSELAAIIDRETGLAEKEAALQRVREDINWMLNNQKFLNPSEFDYLDAALKGA